MDDATLNETSLAAHESKWPDPFQKKGIVEVDLMSTHTDDSSINCGSFDRNEVSFSIYIARRKTNTRKTNNQ